MTDRWDPAIYARFGRERALPVDALVGALPASFAPTRAVDLGCGAGALTRRLAERFPAADLVGVDLSADMLAAAPALPRTTWVQADLASWAPAEPVDLVASNAALHWLDDPVGTAVRMLGALRPGGCLALQVPANTAAPSHRCAEAVGREGPWAERLAGVALPRPVPEPAAWLRALAPHATVVDVWETTWHHRLTGADPVAAWLAGTTLRPWLGALPEDLGRALLDALAARLAPHYGPEPDGTTILPFRRLFVLARTRG